MKRNLDLIRYILTEAERRGTPGLSYFEIPVPEGSSLPELLAHVDLLIDAGFLRGQYSGAHSGKCHVERLTWAGHEFLDATGDDSLWAKAKSAVITQTGAWTVSLLLEYLKQQGRERLGLPLP